MGWKLLNNEINLFVANIIEIKYSGFIFIKTSSEKFSWRFTDMFIY
jgi:hypothetical protein